MISYFNLISKFIINKKVIIISNNKKKFQHINKRNINLILPKKIFIFRGNVKYLLKKDFFREKKKKKKKKTDSLGKTIYSKYEFLFIYF